MTDGKILPDQNLILPDRAKLMEKAKELETAFVGEMLRHAGLGESADQFGAGPGEEQFASFLRNEQARLIVEKGGIGLAESIFLSLVQSQERRRDA